MLLPLLLTLAQATAAAPQSAPDTLPADPNKKICVIEEETGSRLSGKRVCRTKAEWEQLKQQGRAMADRQRNTGAGNK